MTLMKETLAKFLPITDKFAVYTIYNFFSSYIFTIYKLYTNQKTTIDSTSNLFIMKHRSKPLTDTKFRKENFNFLFH